MSRFIKFQAAGNNDVVAKAFGGLLGKQCLNNLSEDSKMKFLTSLPLFYADNMSVARKLFRLFKSFNEYVKIQVIRGGKLPAFEKNLQILARIAFAFYWLFDNLSVLIKVKFLTNFELKQMARRASKCWLLGIILSIICALIELQKATSREGQILISKANSAKSDGAKESNEEFAAQLKAARDAKKTQVLNIIKNLGDGITASQSLAYPQRFFGFNFNDGWVGVGGFGSAAITCYQLYK